MRNRIVYASSSLSPLAVVRSVGTRCSSSSLSLELLLACSLRDISNHPSRLPRAWRRDHVCGEDRTILAPELPLPVVARLGFDHAQRRNDVLDLRLGNDVGGMQPDQFVEGISQHPASARISVDVVALGVGDDDAVRRTLEERAIALLARRRAASVCLVSDFARNDGRAFALRIHLRSGASMDTLRAIGAKRRSALILRTSVTFVWPKSWRCSLWAGGSVLGSSGQATARWLHLLGTGTSFQPRH